MLLRSSGRKYEWMNGILYLKGQMATGIMCEATENVMQQSLQINTAFPI